MYTPYALGIKYSYRQLTSISYFCCYIYRQAFAVRSRFHGGFQLQATPVAIRNFSVRRCFAKLMKFLFPKLRVFLDRVSELSPFLNVKSFRA